MSDWSPVLNHLWQSTLFAAAAAILAFAFHKHRACVRHVIWMAASLKFLIPFALLISIGERIEWRTNSAIVQPTASILMDQVAQPFSRNDVPRAISAQHSLFPLLICTISLAGSLLVLLFWFRRFWRVRAILRRARPLRLEFPIRTMQSPHQGEPGIFGIFRPILLLPEGIDQRLTRAQLDAVLAHEYSHVQRHDNLIAAIHMLVEALFWFHPLVWWIGAKLIEERERACDEAVLLAGNPPGEYAEGILEVCKLYLESPLECAAGVTGGGLKQRIESIMTARLGKDLSLIRKAILVFAGIASIAVPVVFGLWHAPAALAQAAYNGPGFEVASIKPSDPAERGSGIPPAAGGRFRAVNVPTRELIGYAYHTTNRQRISGGPSWLDSERYDVNAKVNGNFGDEKIRPMVLKLLQDRFALKFHHETRQMQTFVLTLAKGGPKFKISDTCNPDPEQKQPCGGFRVYRRSNVSGQQVSAADLAEVLEVLLDEPVLDRTGLKGVFAVQLSWTPDDRTPLGSDAGVSPANPDSPSLFVALQEQLGLKLDRLKADVDVVVIDSAEKPLSN
jgi:bla regulator protein BlaR1